MDLNLKVNFRLRQCIKWGMKFPSSASAIFVLDSLLCIKSNRDEVSALVRKRKSISTSDRVLIMAAPQCPDCRQRSVFASLPAAVLICKHQTHFLILAFLMSFIFQKFWCQYRWFSFFSFMFMFFCNRRKQAVKVTYKKRKGVSQR